MMKTKEDVIENLDTVLHFDLTTDFVVNCSDLANLIVAIRNAVVEQTRQGNKYFAQQYKDLMQRCLTLYDALENKADFIKEHLASYYD